MRKFLILILTTLVLIIKAGGVSFAAQDDVKVIAYIGDVKIIPSGGAETAPQAGMVISPGSKITTGKDSSLDMAFDKNKKNLVRVGSSSQVVVKVTGDSQIELIDGRVLATLKGLKGGSFKVKTPSAVCGARGTGWETETNGTSTDVAVFDDQVYVSGLNPDGTPMSGETVVGEGFESTIGQGGEPGAPQHMDDARLDSLQNEGAGIGSSGGGDTGNGSEGGEPAGMGDLNESNNVDDNRADSLNDKKDKDRFENQPEEKHDEPVEDECKT